MIDRKVLDGMVATAEQLDEMAAMCRGFIDRWLDGTSESFRPQLCVLARRPPDGEPAYTMAMLDVPFNTDVEKRGFMVQFGARFYRDKQVPMAIALMSECWISRQAAGERRKYLIPEDDPNRVEAVMFHVVSLRMTEQRHSHRPIARDARQQLIVGGEWVDFTEGTMRPVLLGYFFKGFFQQLPGYDQIMAELAAGRNLGRRLPMPKVQRWITISLARFTSESCDRSTVRSAAIHDRVPRSPRQAADRAGDRQCALDQLAQRCPHPSESPGEKGAH